MSQVRALLPQPTMEYTMSFGILVLIAVVTYVVVFVLLMFIEPSDGPTTSYGPDLHSVFDKDGPFRRHWH